MYNCIIIDDDQLSIDVIKIFISKSDNLFLHSTFTDPLRAIQTHSDNEVIDFLFLDIRMAISGLEVVQIYRDKVRFLVFVTAYTEYAVEAFKVHSDHYLVKPITFDKFTSAIENILKKEERR